MRTTVGRVLTRVALSSAALLAVVSLASGAVAATAPPVGVPAAAQSNISPYPVLERLGLWDATSRTFGSVAARSISSGPVVVMSHGWSPDYREAYTQLQAQHPDRLITAWDPALVDSAGLKMMTSFEAMAAALQTVDPTARVVMFSWVDQSSTGASLLDAAGPELATEVNGHRLATALDQALAPGFTAGGGQVHLIGHSFGANVVTTAALALTEPPRQVTLLDSPEIDITRIGGAKNDLRYKLPRLDPGRGPGHTFVDNYISVAGERYSTYPGLAAVVDVQTAPPGDDLEKMHTFAIEWYTDSVAASDPQVGYGWSPLIGADDTAVGTYYEQPAVDQPLQLTQVEGPPSPVVSGRLALTTAPLVPAGSTVDGLVVSGDPSGLVGPTTANLTFSTTDDSLWLTFDQRLSGRPGDLLTLFVDGRERSQAAIEDDGTGAAGSFVILYDLAPGSHVLSATISGPTIDAPADASSRVDLTGLAVASTSGITRNLTATETYQLAAAVLASAVAGALALVGLVVLVIVLAVRHRRRRRQEEADDAVVA